MSYKKGDIVVVKFPLFLKKGLKNKKEGLHWLFLTIKSKRDTMM